MSGVAGVRLGRSGPLVWAKCALEQLTPCCLCLLRTPYGDRSARVVVAPGQLLASVPMVSGYTVLCPLSDAEALEVEPASGLSDRARESDGFRAAPSPDGALLTLVPTELESPAPTIPPEILETDAVLVVRGEDSRIPDPALPDLSEEIALEGEAWTVTQISVFRGDVELTAGDGRTATVPLDALPRRES